MNNKIKRICTLLLAIVLTVSMSLQPDIGRAFADNMEQTGQIAESSAKSADGAENAGESSEQLFYEQLMACGSLSDFEALLCAEENSAALGALKKEELNQLAARVDEICAAMTDPTEADAFLKEKVLKKLSEYTGETYQAGDEPGEKGSPAETKKKKAAAKEGEDKTEYIYFDLAAGNVTIGAKTYSGYVFVAGTAKLVTGTHSADNKYYVYQSNTTDQNSDQYITKTGYEKQEDYEKGENCRVPEYPRVTKDGTPWTDYITNNTDVKAVSEEWEKAAKDSQRTGTPNSITFASESGYTADVTIDNVWSIYQIVKNASRKTGGITAHLDTSTNTNIQLKLKGDNRFGNIHYHSREKRNNKIVFSNGDSKSAPGSVTVADFNKNWGGNYWCSAIGGNDNGADKSDGIEINSGVVYAGTTSEDDCTAIGGGGNEYGGVTINGGTVTAVTASTGTAIGGGIGWSSQGGDADVKISGGTVYAYNHGIGPDSGSYTSFVPAVAIGGGSANTNTGNKKTTVTITGGTIYAQSVGGAAIGGGGSGTQTGGDATVNISGGTIIAKSVGKEVNYNKGGNKNHTETVSAGVSIGGGTGSEAGGSVNLNISGGTLRTGSIGGGKATKAGANIGSANVVITGGDITGQVIMAGGAAKNCSFKMSGGKIHGTNVVDGNTVTDAGFEDPQPDTKIQYLEKNGGAVWMQDTNGITEITGGSIEECTAYRGGAIYMEGGTFTLSDMGLIRDNTAQKQVDSTTGKPTEATGDTTGYGGGVYVTGGEANITGGSLSSNSAQIRGGGLYVKGGDVTVSDGSVSENVAGFGIPDEKIDVGRGGGVYLEGGNFTMDGGTISGNEANYRGGGIFLTESPTLNGGTISGNKAKDSGGGLCIIDCFVDLKPENEMTISHNKAKNGAGIYIFSKSNGSGGTGGSETTGSSEKSVITTDAVTEPTPIPDNAVGLRVHSETKGFLHFENNVAEADTDGTGGNGGAVCVDGGRFQLESDKISVKGNKAVNGGGVAVLNGNFTMTAGSIGKKDGANAATNGGGVYVSGGEIWLKGGKINYNTATNGGGAYVAGNYNMIDGNVVSNTAAENGGGVYVNDGTVTMYGGHVDSNTATLNGGGMHISSTDKEALVDIFSGSISSNKSKFGGGVSVVGKSGQSIDVTVGINHEHPNLKNGKFEAFDYPENIGGDYGDAHEAHNDRNNHIYNNGLKHSTCPQVKSNTAEESGGGFYLNSEKSDITVYCLEAEDNTAEKDPDSNCMAVNGGELQIGDEDFDTHLTPNKEVVKGNTTIEGTIMVKGGKVDVYGEMENPKFASDVKVDVQKEEDYYRDHRIKKGEHLDYKVHYYENFKGDGDTPTGLYIARQYPDEEHANVEGDKKYDFTIMSSIFSHPGYKIVGWNTEPDDTGDPYDVNETYNLQELYDGGKLGNSDPPDVEGAHKDEYLLVLYAIWERTGYILKFDPNVGEGETYTGTMADQRVTMGDDTQTISANEFKRPGYTFVGWTLEPSPVADAKVYEDGQTITEDFTDEDGAIVTLYAKWEKCTHEHYLVYTVEDDEDNVLIQSCSKCGGHTAKATLSAVDCNYDGEVHLADLSVSTNWIGEEPEISYDMAASEWDDKDSAKSEWENNPKPKHAGNYTAMITGTNQTKDGKRATAEVKYEIKRIKWETPSVPQISFEVKKGSDNKYNSIIKIETPTGANLMYKITHLSNDGTETGVEDYSDWQEENEFANIPYGMYYYFYAKVSEDRDHIESDPSKSSAYLTTGGNIIYIENGEGIKVEPQYGTGVFQYTVSAADGYHLREYKDNLQNNISMTIGPENIKDFDFVKPIPGAESDDAFIRDGGIKISKTKSDNGVYTYVVEFGNKMVAYHQVTLEFSGAVKDASVTHKVTDGQVFSDFNDKETSISQDSAFTAQFTVNDYIPDEYEGQELRFSQEFLVGTTVIMKADGKYWYCKLTEAKESISLTEFTAMGGTETYELDKESVKTKSKTFTYQFIVDFSQVNESDVINSTNPLKVSLGLIAKDPDADSTSQKAPNIPSKEEESVSLGIEKKAEFDLTLSDILGNSATLNCNYTASDGAASIWNGRDTALVLTATEGTDVPADLTLTAVVGENTTNYTMNAKKKFIIPLGDIGSKEVKLTLNSNTFSSSANELKFTADWYVSQSGAGKSPLNGYKAVENHDITFSCKKNAVPSVRIVGKTHRCKVGGKLDVRVEYKDIPSDGKITAELQVENDGKYTNTGARNVIKNYEDTNKINAPDGVLISFPMGKMSSGSYRILVIVEKNGAYILQVPYYFVIQ